MLIILLEKKFTPLPPEIKVLKNYGAETIVNPLEATPHVSGDVVILDGPEDKMRLWLFDQKQVWQTTSPQLGNWRRHNYAPRFTIRNLYKDDEQLLQTLESVAGETHISVDKKGWFWFWDEVQLDACGPYPAREMAKRALSDYTETI